MTIFRSKYEHFEYVMLALVINVPITFIEFTNNIYKLFLDKFVGIYCFKRGLNKFLDFFMNKQVDHLTMSICIYKGNFHIHFFFFKFYFSNNYILNFK